MKTTNHAEKAELEQTAEETRGDVRQSGVVRAARRSTPEHEVAASMVDALDDILKWERQSERLLRVVDDKS